MPKIAEVKLSSCGVNKKLRLWNYGVAVAEQHSFKKFQNDDCRSASFKLRNCDCGLKKGCACPPEKNFLKETLIRSYAVLYSTLWKRLGLRDRLLLASLPSKHQMVRYVYKIFIKSKYFAVLSSRCHFVLFRFKFTCFITQ